MSIPALPDSVRLVYTYARRLGMSREDAQDCASEFRLRLLRESPSFPDSSAWLHRCAHNYACNYLRSQSRRKQRERTYCEQSSVETITPNEIISGVAGPRTLTMRKALWEYVVSALRHFTPEQRDLFLGYHLRQQTLTQLADSTGRTPAAVTQAIYHIHRRLARLLLAQGWSAADARRLILSAPPPATARSRVSS